MKCTFDSFEVEAFDVGQEVWGIIDSGYSTYTCGMCRGGKTVEHGRYIIKCPQCKGEGKYTDYNVMFKTKFKIYSVEFKIFAGPKLWDWSPFYFTELENKFRGYNVFATEAEVDAALKKLKEEGYRIGNE